MFSHFNLRSWFHLSSDLKPHVHCSYVAAKAFGRCSVLLKGFISNDPHLLVLAYKIYVRPILEYNSPIWSPWLISDVKCIERVQRFFTRTICKRTGISELSYSDRLHNLGLQSLEYRRIFSDLVLCYKTYQTVDLKRDDIFPCFLLHVVTHVKSSTSVHPIIHASTISSATE